MGVYVCVCVCVCVRARARVRAHEVFWFRKIRSLIIHFL